MEHKNENDNAKLKADYKFYNEYKINNDFSDLSKKYISCIRNMTILDEKMIDNIRIMPSENKMDIIIELNNALRYLYNNKSFN
jgi:hypothetical protein